MKSDYLKYWKVIRNYYKIKYELLQVEMDMLLFLYSEPFFTKTKFEQFNTIMTWDKKRFEKMRRKGLIEVFRKKEGSRANLYRISHKSKLMITDMYKKLNGDAISEDPKYNPLFRKKTRFVNKVYRNKIIEMNQEIRKRRLEAQQSED